MGIAVVKPEINRRKLARDMGYSAGYISRILNGKRRASLPLAQEMAHELGMSLDELCTLLKIE